MYLDCLQAEIHLCDFIWREAIHEQKESIADAILRMSSEEYRRIYEEGKIHGRQIEIIWI